MFNWRRLVQKLGFCKNLGFRTGKAGFQNGARASREAIWGLQGAQSKSFRISGSHLKATRPPKERQSAPPKRAKNEPKRAQKDVEEHLYGGNADLSKSNKFPEQHKGFWGSEGPLGCSNWTQRGPKVSKTGNLNTTARENTITTHKNGKAKFKQRSV